MILMGVRHCEDTRGVRPGCHTRNVRPAVMILME